METGEYPAMRVAVEKLTLNDSSVTVHRDSSVALGQGWRLGFLGLLHMDVFRQRLEEVRWQTCIQVVVQTFFLTRSRNTMLLWLLLHQVSHTKVYNLSTSDLAGDAVQKREVTNYYGTYFLSRICSCSPNGWRSDHSQSRSGDKNFSFFLPVIDSQESYGVIYSFQKEPWSTMSLLCLEPWSSLQNTLGKSSSFVRQVSH